MNWHKKEELEHDQISALVFKLGRSRHCMTIKKSYAGAAWTVDIDDQVVCSIPRRIKTAKKRRDFALSVLSTRCAHYQNLGAEIEANLATLRG